MSEHAAPSKREREWRPIVGIAVMIAAVLFLVFYVLFQINHKDSANDRADRIGNTATTLAEQVRQACATGDEGTRKSLGAACADAAEIAANPAVAKGDRGLRGPRGLTGQPGIQGIPGPRGATGKTGAPGVGVKGDSGPQGAKGDTGATGAAGINGTDGKDGKDGTDGKNGVAGEPPVSWTYTDGGQTFTCTRNDPFDRGAPTYVCKGDAPVPAPQ